MSCLNDVTIHHQTNKLGEHLEDDTLCECCHLIRIELNHVVEHLHGDSAVGKPDTPTVHKRLLWYIIPTVVSVDITQFVFIHQQTTDTIARTHPNVMGAVFDDGVYHIIQQTVLAGEYLRQLICTLPK